MSADENTQDQVKLKPFHRMHGDAAKLAVRLRSIISESGVVMMVGGLGSDHGSAQVAMRLSQSLVSLYEHRRILLIDADVKSPTVDEYFELNATKGLADAIIADAAMVDVLNTTAVPKLSILPAIEGDKAHLRNILSTVETPLLSCLRETFPIIIISAPRDIESFEFSVWAAQTDHIILAIGEGIHKANIVEAKKSIEEVGSNLVGVVVTHND